MYVPCNYFANCVDLKNIYNILKIHTKLWRNRKKSAFLIVGNSAKSVNFETSRESLQFFVLETQLKCNTYYSYCKKQPFADVLQNSCPKTFCNIHRKALVLESLFNNFVGLKVSNFIKKETPAKVFSCEYWDIFKNSFFIEHL